MEPADSPRFFQALAALGTMFSDEITGPRQKLYWQLLSPLMTIEEWERACHYALMHETFHKVPLPATLIECLAKAKEHDRKERVFAAKPYLRGLMLD